MNVQCMHCGRFHTVEPKESEQRMACPTCHQELVVPAEPAAATQRSASVPRPLDAEVLRDPKERRAYRWLMAFAVLGALVAAALIVFSTGLILLIVLPFVVLKYLAEWLAYAYLKSNAIRISENQLPEIHTVAAQFAQRLDMKCPAIYVLQETTWNAVAMKLVRDRVVLLLSGATDAILQKGNLSQLAWLVGHEMGHHHAGHLSFWPRFAATFGGWMIWIRLWYSRRCEFTADRYGLACARSLTAALGALGNLAAGAQLANRLSVPAALKQWEQHRGEFGVRYRAIYSTHPHLLHRLHETVASSQALGIWN